MMVGRICRWGVAAAAMLALQPVLAVETSSAPGRPVAPPSASVGQPLSAADQEIASTLVPKAKFIQANLLGFRKTFNATLERDAETKSALAAHPGLKDAIGSSVATLLENVLSAEYPALRDSIAAVIAAKLERGDHAIVMAYLRSPAGVRLISSIYGESTQDTVAERVTGRTDPTESGITREDVAAMAAQVQREALIRMSKEEIRATAEFGATGAGRRFTAAQKPISDLSLAWVNNLITSRTADINEAVMLAAQKYYQEKK